MGESGSGGGGPGMREGRGNFGQDVIKNKQKVAFLYSCLLSVLYFCNFVSCHLNT